MEFVKPTKKRGVTMAPKGYLITEETARLIGRTARAVFGDPTDTTRRRRKTRWTGGGGTSTPETHPWQATRADSDDDKRITVYPGTINGLVPTNIFTAFAITGEGTEYLVLTLTATSGASPVSAALAITDVYPEPSATTASTPPLTATDVLAVLADGVVYQIRDTNLTAGVYEVLQESVVNPGPYERNYVPWYRWEVSPYERNYVPWYRWEVSPT